MQSHRKGLLSNLHSIKTHYYENIKPEENNLRSLLLFVRHQSRISSIDHRIQCTVKQDKLVLYR